MRTRFLATAVVILATTSFLAAAAGGSIGAFRITVKGGIDLTGVVLSCPNEMVSFSGVATLLQTQSTTPSGVQTTIYVFNLSKVSALGQTTSTRYRVVGATVGGFSFSIGSGSGADTFKFVQTWLLVPMSGGKPLSFHEVLTVIYDANGELASVVSQGPGDCD